MSSKGGSASSSVQIPDWIKGPAERNLARAETAAQIGYMPYYGPDVAAFSPQQQQAQQMAFGAGQAFGLIPQTQQFSTGLPQAQTFAGGLQGYSSGSLYDQAVAELAARNPTQAAKYNSLYDSNTLFNNPALVDALKAGGNATPSLNANIGSSHMFESDIGPSAWDTMSDSEKAAYYRENPTMAGITQAGQKLLGMSAMGALQNKLDPRFVGRQQNIAQGINPDYNPAWTGSGTGQYSTGSGLGSFTGGNTTYNNTLSDGSTYSWNSSKD